MRRTPPLFRPTSSAIDATRFTSTSPHAFSRPPVRTSPPSASPFSPSASPQRPPSSLSSRISPLKSPNLNVTIASHPNPVSHRAGAPSGGGSPAPESETSAQKVARLRAARAAARDNVQISTWDRVVVTGRAWSDVIHRVTAVGLIGLTVLAGLVTLYGVGSMVTYNRKKRTAFYADEMRTQQELVVAAIEAEREGRPMTEEQQLMLNRVKARYQAEELKKSQPGFLKWMMAPITGRLGSDEGSEEGRAEGALANLEKEAEGWEQVIEKKGEEVVQAVTHGEREIEKGLKETAAGNLMDGGKEAEAAVLGGLERSRREAENHAVPQAASIDQMAEAATEVGKKKVEGWRAWFGG